MIWVWSFRPASLESAVEGLIFVLLGIVAVGVVLRMFNVPLERYDFIKSFKHRPDLQQLCGRKTVIVAPDGLTFASDISEDRIYWSAIDRIETVGTLIIVTADNSLYIVPNRAFSDDTASKQFVATIDEYRRAAVR